jgi:CheY-like chemotaxis protein
MDGTMARAADSSTAGTDPSAKVRRLRPLRILLALRDRKFMRVTCFLLERRGYDVVQDGSARVVEAAARVQPDVVVFEAETSRGSSARILAGLAALPRAPGVIAIVEQELHGSLLGVPAVAKWTPVDELAREIDAASLCRGRKVAREIPGP